MMQSYVMADAIHTACAVKECFWGGGLKLLHTTIYIYIYIDIDIGRQALYG